MSLLSPHLTVKLIMLLLQYNALLLKFVHFVKCSIIYGWVIALSVELKCLLTYYNMSWLNYIFWNLCNWLLFSFHGSSSDILQEQLLLMHGRWCKGQAFQKENNLCSAAIYDKSWRIFLFYLTTPLSSYENGQTSCGSKSGGGPHTPKILELSILERYSKVNSFRIVSQVSVLGLMIYSLHINAIDG